MHSLSAPANDSSLPSRVKVGVALRSEPLFTEKLL